MFFEKLAEINGVINDFVWVRIGLVLLIGTGILMTCCTKFFQLSHIRHWWKQTIGSLFTKDSATTKKTDKKTISKLSGKKKYYVRVRSYTTVKGKKYYGAWSSTKSVTTKK